MYIKLTWTSDWYGPVRNAFDASDDSGSVTTQSIALKYVMASEPYRYTWYLKQVMVGSSYIKIF